MKNMKNHLIAQNELQKEAHSKTVKIIQIASDKQQQKHKAKLAKEQDKHEAAHDKHKAALAKEENKYKATHDMVVTKGETALRKEQMSREKEKKMWNASVARVLKKQQGAAAKLLKASKSTSTRALKKQKVDFDAMMKQVTASSQNTLTVMQTEVDHNAEFISSLLTDLELERDAKMEAVEMGEANVLKEKGRVKGLIHDERQQYAEKQMRAKRTLKRRQQQEKDITTQLQDKSKYSCSIIL